MSDDFPAELKQFIAQHVESLAQLEALLILRQDPLARWQATELAKRLYITPEMCEAILANLRQHGFAELAAEGYYYQAKSAEADRTLADLCTMYQQRRVAVITEIYSKPVSKVQTFADAFRLRREEP
jgi:hypothetical protein